MTPDLFAGIIVGLAIAIIALIISHVGKRAKSDPETVSLNPNDFPVPTILWPFECYTVTRSTSIDGNKITMTWKYKGATMNRYLTIKDATTAQHTFAKHWAECEVAFFMNNRELFENQTKKKGKKK